MSSNSEPERVGSHIRKATRTLATDAEEAGELETDIGPITGRLESIGLIVGSLDAAGTVTVTKVETGQVVATGTVAEFSVAAETPIDFPACVMANESLAVEIENGGVSKSGTLVVYWS